ncbi:MAG TPA: hypothetical protein VKA70_12105 [Blastocatellia bacterium]|nr:hypothetical protein [Blastocatellia bacterium]
MPKANTAQLDRKIDWVKDRLAKTIDIALERVIAHHENPQTFPLPNDPKSLERAFHKMFASLPRRSQKDAVERVNKTLKAGRDARTKIYGDLADVDFRSKTPIVDQVKVKPVPDAFKFTEADATELRNRLKSRAAKPRKSSKPQPAQGVEALELAFEVVNLTCVRPTDVRKDEMSLAGVGIDNVGEEINVAPFFVGNFKSGDSLALNNKIFNFKLTVGQFPKTFISSIFLVETDWIRNSDFVNGLLVVIFATASALVAIASVMVIVGLAGGPFAPILTAAILGAGAFLGLTWTALRRMVDDISFPNGDTLVLDAPVAPGTIFDVDPLGFQIGELKGRYTATARWVAS